MHEVETLEGAGDEEVHATVVVVVSSRDHVALGDGLEAGAFGFVDKAQAMVIFVVAGAAEGAVGDDVEPAIAIEVFDGDAFACIEGVDAKFAGVVFKKEPGVGREGFFPALAIEGPNKGGVDAVLRGDTIRETVDGHVAEVEEPAVKEIGLVVVFEKLLKSLGGLFSPLFFLVVVLEGQRAGHRGIGVRRAIHITHVVGHHVVPGHYACGSSGGTGTGEAGARKGCRFGRARGGGGEAVFQFAHTNVSHGEPEEFVFIFAVLLDIGGELAEGLLEQALVVVDEASLEIGGGGTIEGGAGFRQVEHVVLRIEAELFVVTRVIGVEPVFCLHFGP